MEIVSNIAIATLACLSIERMRDSNKGRAAESDISQAVRTPSAQCAGVRLFDVKGLLS